MPRSGAVAAIAGVGQTELSSYSGSSAARLLLEATTAAIADTVIEAAGRRNLTWTSP
jgi:hypothetical protein